MLAFTVLPSIVKVLIRNSTPMVAFLFSSNWFLQKREMREDLPTAESPIRMILRV